MPPKFVLGCRPEAGWYRARTGAVLSQKPLLLWSANPQGTSELEHW
ncbi:hypothetical protein I8U17_13125 [Thermoactinomyces sp. CICC 10521]|uniref:Uncharacterized protein n=1 Tax=Thermoactinomyces daqus TaxID=1329516 RepID=A0A7W2AHZ6_9BACL|nr:hypothetical protein [Thermoactinomyces daqus]MBH8597498.1 hypothetical protein [Thermoactinomyces sp. CICC 10523]MBH8603839.1 hypothetical protein [Thermoactinomyces sp. CICC 10522]MBH8608552.1 hypothetical protein [Thermoactinomyces sp. CICC 10521]